MKIPEIRRENYEYHVKITYKLISEEDDTKLKSRILRCEIFKEYENVDMTDDESGSCMTFDCDMFITEDSVYGLLYCIYSSGLHITPFIIITGLNDIKAVPMKYNLFIYPGTAMLDRYADDALFQMTNIFGKFWLSPRSISRWMYRNSIMDIISKYSVYGKGKNGVYPVYIDSFKDISEILESSIECSPVTYDMMTGKHGSSNYMDEELIESAGKYGRKEYFVYNEGASICIQPAYPFPFDGRYVYAKFSLEYNKVYSVRMNRSFIYMTEFMNDNKDSSFEIERFKETSDIDFIEFGKYKRMKTETDKYRLRYMFVIRYVYGYGRNHDLKKTEEKVLSSRMITKHGNDNMEYMKTSEGNDILTMSFDAEADITIENTFDFINNVKDSVKVIHHIILQIFDRKSSRNIYTDFVHGKNIMKNKVNNPGSLSDFENILKDFGFSVNKIKEWETDNGLFMIDENVSSNILIYMKSCRCIGKFMRTIKDAYVKKGNQNADNDRKNPIDLIRFLESNEVKEYILGFYNDIMSEDNMSMTLRTLYPYKINGEYKYIYIETYGDRKEDSGQYMYIKDMSNRLSNLRIAEGMDVSDIKLCKVDSKGNIEQ